MYAKTYSQPMPQGIPPARPYYQTTIQAPNQYYRANAQGVPNNPPFVQAMPSNFQPTQPLQPGFQNPRPGNPYSQAGLPIAYPRIQANPAGFQQQAPIYQPVQQAPLPNQAYAPITRPNPQVIPQPPIPGTHIRTLPSRPLTTEEQARIQTICNQLTSFSKFKCDTSIASIPKQGIYNPGIAFAGNQIILDDKLFDLPIEVLAFSAGHEWAHNIFAHTKTGSKTHKEFQIKEDDADRFACRFMIAHNYPIDGVIPFFTKIYNDAGEQHNAVARTAKIKDFYDGALKELGKSNAKSTKTFADKATQTNQFANKSVGTSSEMVKSKPQKPVESEEEIQEFLSTIKFMELLGTLKQKIKDLQSRGNCHEAYSSACSIVTQLEDQLTNLENLQIGINDFKEQCVSIIESQRVPLDHHRKSNDATMSFFNTLAQL
ncbi:MAG: hypothetical protein ACHP6H_06785, partial [Legionellales bacterium]